MFSHNIVKCMDAKRPASLSPKIHRILREELGYTGVIMTDSLSMDAITKFARKKSAAVMAVRAGNDLLCVKEFTKHYKAVLAAVKKGIIDESRIDESVRRILIWKLDLGIIPS
jgi:beta-N-acetylhexosaminidase